MERLVIFLSRTSISIWGLVFFNFLVLIVNLKFLFWIDFIPYGIGPINISDFRDLTNSLAIRLSAVGILILESQNVLRLAGIVPKDSVRDEITERAHPFGMFYLCAGVLMQCFIEQVNMPGKFLDVTILHSVVVWGIYVVAVISLLANLNLFYVLKVCSGHKLSIAHPRD